jgi:hypothetical protein
MSPGVGSTGYRVLLGGAVALCTVGAVSGIEPELSDAIGVTLLGALGALGLVAVLRREVRIRRRWAAIVAGTPASPAAPAEASARLPERSTS